MIVGIGSDLVDCTRIEKTIKRFGDRFLNRLFTFQEQERINSQSNQAAGYAKLFAMKEAVLKALGTGLTRGITWLDIEILREVKSKPFVKLSGVALECARNQMPKEHTLNIHVSVSDEWPYAQAFAIVSAESNLSERVRG